ncbi:MAG: amidohydrolase family protein, partial [Gemmatimonadota bacterium]
MSPRLPLHGSRRIPRRSSPHFGLAALVGMVLVPLTASPSQLWAQPRPVHPEGITDFAVTGARIVVGNGDVIRRGTVVISDGLITAVGSDVSVPEGAWVVQAEGLTVYPGFMDALTTLGHPGSGGGGASAGGPGRSGASGDHSWGPEDRPGTHTWLSGADDLSADDARIEKWRRAGFTTTVSAPDAGLVPGQAAVLDLGRVDRPREMVVATPVGMKVKLRDRSFSGYPNSLMGSFAYLQQLYLDAQFYDRIWRDYEEDPAGKTRPEWDRALEPLRTQLGDQYPVLFPAQNRKEIARAVESAGVMGVPLVVYGAQGAYGATDLLSDAGVPALVNVDWPGPDPKADPEDAPGLETLRLWEHAPTTPARLEAAGVPFAFYSGDLKDPAKMLEGVRRAVTYGLSQDAAVRALTLEPARIFGVDDRLGSVEAGKIANLVVASGSIFDPGSRVEVVFVDGEKISFPSEEEAGGSGSGKQGAKAKQVRAAREESGKVVPMSPDKGPFRSDPVTLIKNATILTASHGRIEGGSILIRDGKIAAVGPDVEAPRGAHVVDAEGKFVTPGIIDAHSHIAADAINEGAVNVSAMVGIQDVMNPTDISIYRALAGGVTSINILHGSANPIGGKNAVIKLRWGGDK